MTRRFPLPPPADDARFTFGLTYSVAKVLAEHGYPDITGAYDDAGLDFTQLQLALFRFLYAAEPTPTPTPTPTPPPAPVAPARAGGWDYPREEPENHPAPPPQVEGFALGRWKETP